MTTPSRPPPHRTPRALRPRRKGPWIAAALLGALGAALLVGGLLPGDTGVPLADLRVEDAPPPVAPRVVRPPPAVPAPAPASRAQPAEPPLDAPEGPTAANRQWFRVELVEADGSPAPGGVMPVACDGFDYDRKTGLHSAFAPSTCILEGVRQDGALMRRTSQATLQLVADGAPQAVRLSFPEERTGGIGVRFMPTSTGMRVVDLVEGGPAWEAGLEVGDVIITVDGEAVDGLEQQEFVRRMTGPEGSTVEFEILYTDPDGATPGSERVVEQVRVNRRYLDG